MYYFNTEKIIEVTTDSDKKMVSDFLKNQGLSLEEDVEYTIALLKEDKIIGTGSLSGRVLKCIAIEPQFQGIGLLNKIVSHLVNEAYFRGNTHLFIYTKPKNKILFNDVGFYEIAEVPNKVCLLENKLNGIQSYAEELKQHRIEGDKIAAVVMNCNPFTLGHQYIIEKASYENDIVHIFIVWEDRSSFPSEVRYNLVKEGTKHLSNVILHKGKDYIISNATFPSYFLKEKSNVVEIQAKLDIEIFKNYIVPALGINKRYVGEEPYCEVTKTYNKVMKEILPKVGVEVEEIKRASINGEYISASKVRKWLVSNELSKAKSFLPKTTYEYVKSDEGQKIIDNMSRSNKRH